MNYIDVATSISAGYDEPLGNDKKLRHQPVNISINVGEFERCPFNIQAWMSSILWSTSAYKYVVHERIDNTTCQICLSVDTDRFSSA